MYFLKIDFILVGKDIFYEFFVLLGFDPVLKEEMEKIFNSCIEEPLPHEKLNWT